MVSGVNVALRDEVDVDPWIRIFFKHRGCALNLIQPGRDLTLCMRLETAL
jgi:hypothetical protein